MAKVRDKRQCGFFMIENSLIDDHGRTLGVAGIAVYALIVRCADRSTGRTWPTYAIMTKRLGISRRTCARVVRRLVKLGLVDVTRTPGRQSVYTLRTIAGLVGELGAPPASAEGETGSLVTGDSGHQGTATGSLVAPPRFPGVMTPPNAPYGFEQNPTTTASVVAVAGDELGVKNAQGEALLTAQGVSPAIARTLADTTDIDLLRAIVRYWESGAGGVKPVGTGLLVAMCRRPVAYGFVQRDGVWIGPKGAAPRRPARSSPAGAAEEDPMARAKRLAEEARQRREQDAKDRAASAKGRKLTTV